MQIVKNIRQKGKIICLTIKKGRHKILIVPHQSLFFGFTSPVFLHFVSIKQGRAQPLNFAKLPNLCYYAPFRRFRVFLNKAKPFVNKAKMKVADIEKVTNAPIVHIERTTTVLGLHYSFLSTSRIIT